MKIPLMAALLLVLLTGCASADPEVPAEPPALTVRCGEAAVEALRGTTSWYYDNGDGTQSGFVADSLHPLDEAARDLTPQLVFPASAEAPETALEWDLAPDSVTVHCWSDTLWGDTSAPAEDLTVEDLTFALLSGGHIYEIVAQWTSADTWGGTASYSFHAGPAA